MHVNSIDDYEENLVAYWKNRRAVQRVIHKSLTAQEHGRLLLADCGMHQPKLQGLEVPAFFTPGSFHALAEEKTVGWHPEYQTLLSGGGNDGDPK